MRFIVGVVMLGGVLTATGCGGENADSVSTSDATTVATVGPASTDVPVAGSTPTSTAPVSTGAVVTMPPAPPSAPSTTMTVSSSVPPTTAPAGDPGDESIGVRDEVRVVVIDPSD